MSGFTFDERALKRELNKAVRQGLEDVASEHQKMFDSLRRRYRGRPVSEIKPVLQREWARVNGGSISDPELTTYATHISEGTHIQMVVE